jgi:hypothetical protein
VDRAKLLAKVLKESATALEDAHKVDSGPVVIFSNHLRHAFDSICSCVYVFNSNKFDELEAVTAQQSIYGRHPIQPGFKK